MLRVATLRLSRNVSWRGLCTTVREPPVVGLPEYNDPRKTLADLYQQTLNAVQKIPESAAYRSNVEKITKYRLDVVNSSDDIEKIEATLNVGQMPEIIDQAKDELELIPHMLSWKPWETNSEKPAVIEVID